MGGMNMQNQANTNQDYFNDMSTTGTQNMQEQNMQRQN
jgi:hypothetical protein